MIPVSITIKGIYSYQEEQTIDFKPLMEGQIFGIFGPVGSGKSTILEAICFALYDETERLLKRGDNRNYNMMNLKSDNLLIDFVFRNFDEELYRFVVKGKRLGTNFDTVRTFTRSAYRKVKKENEEEWLPIEDASAENILGLSYQNFRRTIIIPQGRFQEFLQLGDKARTDMLKELFHLSKYEFFRQAATLDRKNLEKITFLEGQLSRFKGIDKKAIKESKKEAKKLEQHFKVEQKLLSEKEKSEKEMAVLKIRFDEFHQKKSDLSLLEKQKQEIDQLRKLVKNYEYCATKFKPILDKKKEAKLISQTKKGALTKEVDQFDKLKDRLIECKKNFEVAKEKHDRVEDLKKELADYKILLKLVGIRKEFHELDSRQAQLESELKTLEADNQTITTKLKTEKNTFKTLKKSKPDTWDLADIDKWFDHNKILQEQLVLHEQTTQKREVEIDNFKLNWWKDISPEIQIQLSDLKKEPVEIQLDKIKMLQKAHTKKVNEAFKQLENLKLHKKFENFKHELKPGESCPLCGSLEHPNVLEDKEIESKYQTAESIHSQLKVDEQSFLRAEQIIEKATGDLKLLIASYEESRQFQSKFEIQIQDHLKKFTWAHFHPEKETEFRRVKDQMKQTEKELRDLEVSIEQSEKAISAKQEKLSLALQKSNELKTLQAGKESEAKTYTSQLKILKEWDFAGNEVQINNAKSALENEVNIIENQYTTLHSELDQLNKWYASSEGTIEQMKKDFEEHESRLVSISTLLSSEIDLSVYKDVEEVEDVLRQNINVEFEKTRLTAYDQKVYKLDEDLKQLNKLLEGANFDPDVYKKLMEEVINVRQKSQQLNNTLVSLNDQIKREETDLETKTNLEKETNKLRLRGEDLRKLRNLFQGGGFVNFISSVYLDNLCEAANERFSKLTRQQLRLEINETNNFEVKDFLNDGKSRSVKTLSGGQTFQAALSLALALADSVQEQNKSRQNFFFLDEGFGSLDKESLQTVFETLKQLRKENRIVGVISHVEDLQQEIDVFLKIKNDPEKGSQLQPSWKD